jgi:hypothetical protein
MGALGRPARSLPPWYQTNLVFAVSPVVSVRRNVACEMEAVQKRLVSRIILVACTGRSLAGYCWFWPDEVSRPLDSSGRTAVFASLVSLRPSE